MDLKNLKVKLATTKDEILACERLRYKVFILEDGVVPSAKQKEEEREYDDADKNADFIMIKDTSLPEGYNAVGFTRVFMRKHAKLNGGFLTANQYDLTNIENYDGEILEVGRTCVDKEYRSSMTMKKIWQGLSRYVIDNDIKVFFGVASFIGIDPKEFAETLSYFYHYHQAPKELYCPAIEKFETVSDTGTIQKGYAAKMDYIPKEELNVRELFKKIPPVIKGYVRVGMLTSDKASVDEGFNSTDILIIVKIDDANRAYFDHFVSRNKEEF